MKSLFFPTKSALCQLYVEWSRVSPTKPALYRPKSWVCRGDPPSQFYVEWSHVSPTKSALCRMKPHHCLSSKNQRLVLSNRDGTHYGAAESQVRFNNIMCSISTPCVYMCLWSCFLSKLDLKTFDLGKNRILFKFLLYICI